MAPQVNDLLNSLNWHNPGVLSTLNRAKLHEWQAFLASRDNNRDALFKSTGISWWTVMMVIWFILAVLRVATQASGPERELERTIEPPAVRMPDNRELIPIAPPPDVQTTGAGAAPRLAPAPAQPGQPGTSSNGEAIAREFAECLGPDAPARSSNGRFNCVEIRKRIDIPK